MKMRLLSFLLTIALIVTAAILWEDLRIPVIRLNDCNGIADLLEFDGQEVTLEGAMQLGFETSVVFPRRLLHNSSGKREPVIWVDTGNSDGFSELFDRLKIKVGDVRVHGVLTVSTEGGFGHMGMCQGEIGNAVVTLRPPQSVALMVLVILLLGALMVLEARSQRKE